MGVPECLELILPETDIVHLAYLRFNAGSPDVVD